MLLCLHIDQGRLSCCQPEIGGEHRAQQQRFRCKQHTCGSARLPGRQVDAGPLSLLRHTASCGVAWMAKGNTAVCSTCWQAAIVCNGMAEHLPHSMQHCSMLLHSWVAVQLSQRFWNSHAMVNMSVWLRKEQPSLASTLGSKLGVRGGADARLTQVRVVIGSPRQELGGIILTSLAMFVAVKFNVATIGCAMNPACALQASGRGREQRQWKEPCWEVPWMWTPSSRPFKPSLRVCTPPQPQVSSSHPLCHYARTNMRKMSLIDLSLACSVLVSIVVCRQKRFAQCATLLTCTGLQV